MLMKSLALAALIGAASGPALAGAVTYTGTLGGQAIVLELTEMEDGPMVGRYSYLAKGADIPLHPLRTETDGAVLAEEVPCTPAICERADGNLVLDPPLGAHFSLHPSADRMRLTGTWRAPSGAALPVDLVRFGRRSFERDENFLYSSFLWTRYDGSPITPETSPYDYAKMQVTLTEGPIRTVNGATYREVIDPRTRFVMPRMVSLPGGGDIGPINAMLDQLHWAINFTGFECLDMDYRSQGWMPVPFGNAATSLGGVDRTRISIDYLSDRVMTIRATGRYDCGGGDPVDYTSRYTYDVRAGRVLEPSEIFRDWDSSSDNPSPKLTAWILSAYRKASDFDADFAEGCLTDDNITDGLGVSYAQGDVALFFLDDLEDTGCIGPVLSVPLVSMKGMLTDKAADFFPSLKR
jgi:hypothetical protein